MGTAEVIKYLDDNQFGKKSYEWANIHRKDNFYEQMDKSVKYLYCESRFKKKSFYDKVEVCSVQEFEQMISLFL